MRYAVLSLALALAACSGGTPTPTPTPQGVADPLAYLAQSANCDGNVATPLRQADAIHCRRADFSMPAQIEDSFLTPDGGAVTTWSYPPYGPFSAANGDGGEHYTVKDGVAAIDSTQDGGTPGVQHFPIPWVVVAQAKPCADGWTRWDSLERGCEASLTYPGGITADTYVSDHGDAHALERIFMARGWGRLAWFAYVAGGAPVDRSRCPFEWTPPTGYVLTDCRIVTRIILPPQPITGSQEW